MHKIWRRYMRYTCVSYLICRNLGHISYAKRGKSLIPPQTTKSGNIHESDVITGFTCPARNAQHWWKRCDGFEAPKIQPSFYFWGQLYTRPVLFSDPLCQRNCHCDSRTHCIISRGIRRIILHRKSRNSCWLSTPRVHKLAVCCILELKHTVIHVEF